MILIPTFLAIFSYLTARAADSSAVICKLPVIAHFGVCHDLLETQHTQYADFPGLTKLQMKIAEQLNGAVFAA